MSDSAHLQRNLLTARPDPAKRQVRTTFQSLQPWSAMRSKRLAA